MPAIASHGLIAETVVTAFEDADDYETLEAAIRADYRPQSAIGEQLIARMASLHWRLHRATSIETGLFEVQGAILEEQRIDCASSENRNRQIGALRQILDPRCQAC